MWLFKPFLKWNLNPKMSNQSFFDGWLDMFHKFLVCYVVSLSTEMKWAIIIISSHGCARHNYRALIVYFCCGLLEVAYCVHVMKRPCNIKTTEMYYRDCSCWNSWAWNCSSVGGGAEQRGSLIFHTSPWLEWMHGAGWMSVFVLGVSVRRAETDCRLKDIQRAHT